MPAGLVTPRPRCRLLAAAADRPLALGDRRPRVHSFCARDEHQPPLGSLDGTWGRGGRGRGGPLRGDDAARKALRRRRRSVRHRDTALRGLRDRSGPSCPPRWRAFAGAQRDRAHGSRRCAGRRARPGKPCMGLAAQRCARRVPTSQSRSGLHGRSRAGGLPGAGWSTYGRCGHTHGRRLRAPGRS